MTTSRGAAGGAEKASTAASGTRLFTLTDIRFNAEGRDIVAPLTLELEPACIIGLVGPNGSGKSTLIKMLARQLSPTRGEIRFRDRRLDAFAARDFARHVAYMPQFTPPAEGMTVRELAGLGRFPWHGALGRFTAADGSKVEHALTLVDLLGLSGRLVDSLSGGERQRAWLAMMLAQDTDCLLLDEPTSALDIGHQVEILALVRQLSRARGLGVIVVLHDINMAARYCDEILAMVGGRLVARGTPEDVLAGDRLAEIYGVEMGVLPHPATGQPISYVL